MKGGKLCHLEYPNTTHLVKNAREFKTIAVIAFFLFVYKPNLRSYSLLHSSAHAIPVVAVPYW